ncbi:MAG: hypothetical protein NTY19_19745 [Planctomycetota bacterium]|nr:hypothetical protein [Planctomycetota bacterium]
MVSAFVSASVTLTLALLVRTYPIVATTATNTSSAKAVDAKLARVRFRRHQCQVCSAGVTRRE